MRKDSLIAERLRSPRFKSDGNRFSKWQLIVREKGSTNSAQLLQSRLSYRSAAQRRQRHGGTARTASGLVLDSRQDAAALSLRRISRSTCRLSEFGKEP
jgi:hypothetical protein